MSNIVTPQSDQFIFTTSRDMTAITASVTTSGLFKRPKTILFIAFLANTNTFSVGWATNKSNSGSVSAMRNYCGFRDGAVDTWDGDSAHCIELIDTAGNSQEFAVTTMDSDGFYRYMDEKWYAWRWYCHYLWVSFYLMDNLSEHEQLFARKIIDDVRIEIGPMKNDIAYLKRKHSFMKGWIAGLSAAAVLLWEFIKQKIIS